MSHSIRCASSVHNNLEAYGRHQHQNGLKYKKTLPHSLVCVEEGNRSILTASHCSMVPWVGSCRASSSRFHRPKRSIFVFTVRTWWLSRSLTTFGRPSLSLTIASFGSIRNFGANSKVPAIMVFSHRGPRWLSSLCTWHVGRGRAIGQSTFQRVHLALFRRVSSCCRSWWTLLGSMYRGTRLHLKDGLSLLVDENRE